MSAESGKIDPMHQFLIQPLVGEHWQIAGQSIAFTNSALWMALTFGAIWLFMLGGMKRELVPGRWQVAVEGFTGFVAAHAHGRAVFEQGSWRPLVACLLRLYALP